MESLRIPLDVWGWPGTGIAVLAAPALAALGLATEGPGAGTLVAACLAVTAGGLFYLDAHVEAVEGRHASPSALAVLLAGLVLLGLGPVTLGLLAPAGGVLLAGTGAVLLRRSIDRQGQAAADLRESLLALQLGQREDRARLHEIDATVAGIASAQRLLSDGLARDRSDALAAMVRAEVERLHRLVSDRAPVRRRSVDLDDVVGQLVLAHVARGRQVTWEPSGLRALGRRDDIAEVLNILLENAAVHGGPGPVRVDVDEDVPEGGLVITVSDRGPGVPPGLRDRVFDWGVQRPGSPGQGIGLHTAADIAHDLGGRLELVETTRGAAFALHLPAAPREVTARDRVAHAS